MKGEIGIQGFEGQQGSPGTFYKFNISICFLIMFILYNEKKINIYESSA